MNLFHVLLLVISWLLVVAVLLPLVRNDYWIFRIFEYPRYQKLMLCIVVLAGLVIFHQPEHTFSLITIAVLGICLLYLLVKIQPYTGFSKKEMKTVNASDTANQLKILTANVYQDNTEFDKLVSLITAHDPDVILLLETDDKWANALKRLDSKYSHHLKKPLDNTYGLLFYSKLPFAEAHIKHLVEHDVPSVEATLQLPSGQLVKVWGLHPKPPVPNENTRSTAKDKELLKVAFKAKEEKLPVIVMGDLNDVAWSYVTNLFRKTSELLDPRRGRGFYSTFSANHRFMRFPLDYVFCSSTFGLIDMQRLPHIGSDHFPMFIHLQYLPNLEQVQETPHADHKEISEASEKASVNV